MSRRVQLLLKPLEDRAVSTSMIQAEAARTKKKADQAKRKQKEIEDLQRTDLDDILDDINLDAKASDPTSGSPQDPQPSPKTRELNILEDKVTSLLEPVLLESKAAQAIEDARNQIEDAKMEMEPLQVALSTREAQLAGIHQQRLQASMYSALASNEAEILAQEASLKTEISRLRENVFLARSQLCQEMEHADVASRALKVGEPEMALEAFALGGFLKEPRNMPCFYP